jgi:hypothetical protein
MGLHLDGLAAFEAELQGMIEEINCDIINKMGDLSIRFDKAGESCFVHLSFLDGSSNPLSDVTREMEAHLSVYMLGWHLINVSNWGDRGVAKTNDVGCFPALHQL